jgi:sugar O-acyltransferase (sialic acid O-acetyltransferase NeuD family)
MIERPYIILGAGGHARVVADTLRSAGEEVRGCVAPIPPVDQIPGCPWLGDEDAVVGAQHEIVLANGVGSIGAIGLRRAIYIRWQERGFRFPPIISPRAVIGGDVQVAAGVVIFAGVVLQTGVRIDENVLVNTCASIDHDSQIGAHSHVAPGAVLCGSVRIGLGVHVGAGSVIVQEKQIGNNAVIGAGAVVLGDVPMGAVIHGTFGPNIRSEPT